MKGTDHNHNDQDEDPDEYALANLRESLVNIRQCIGGLRGQTEATESSILRKGDMTCLHGVAALQAKALFRRRCLRSWWSDLLV